MLMSVVIITLNEAERIANLLDDLARQSYRDFEVIVVDSNSDDETCEIARGFAKRLPSLTVHRMTQRGVCLGRNTGAQLARYQRLLFLDADVRLAADFLAKAARQLARRQLDVAGVYTNAKALPLHFRLGYHAFNVGIFASQFGFPTAIGACLFSTQSVHTALGGFDETITLCEDCDYVNRASQIARFGMLNLSFNFDPRRLRQDGYWRTGLKYLHANVYRFFVGEIRDHKIRYEFGHYKKNG